MSAWINAAQLEVHPGEGLVGRWPGAAIVLLGVDLAAPVEGLIGGSGWPRPELLRDRAESFVGTTPFAVVIEQPARDSVWVFSAGVGCFDPTGERLSDGGITVSPGAGLSIGAPGVPVGIVPSHPALTLVEGLVPGAGAVLRVDVGLFAEANDAPTAVGVGAAVFDDGSTYGLDHSYVLGREPESREVAGFLPIVLRDVENSVSRAHAELEVRDGNVLLTDLGSTNGTHLLDAESNQWSRLVPNVPTMLEIGSRVAVGSRQFVIEPTAQ